MKKTLLNLLFLAFVSVNTNTYAQPTLTAAGCNPILGYSTNTASTAGFAQGPSGANQTWNFASLVSTGSNAAQYVTVASTPNATQFSTSNLAAFGGGAYSYYNITNNAYTLNGVVAPSSGTVIPYSNGEDILRFPFTFGNSYTDTWAANFTSGINFFRTGSTIVTADGYGTLITPNGTYSNTLRIHFVQTYQDSTEFGNYNYVNDEYFWYKDGIKEALAFTYTLSSTFGGSTSTSTAGSYATGTVGIEESPLNSSIALFPNPAQETLNLSINEENISNAKVKMINQLGQDVSLVENVNNIAGNNMQFDIAHLKNGMYTLQLILEDNSVINKRFTVNK